MKGIESKEKRAQSERVIPIMRAVERVDLGDDEMPTSHKVRYQRSDFCH